MAGQPNEAELLQPKARLGVVVPPANPTVETELRFLLPQTLGLHVARFETMPGLNLEQRNLRYLDLYPTALDAFGNIELSGLLMALTGPSYRLLPEGDERLCKELSAKAGRPIGTSSLAITRCLQALRVERLALISPYPAWLTESAVTYWDAAGHRVVQVVSVSESFRAYELTSGEVAQALAAVDQDACQAVLMSGTGMLTLPTIRQAIAEARVPLLSSNLCSAWWLSRLGGATPGEQLRSSCPQLAEVLSPARLGASGGG